MDEILSYLPLPLTLFGIAAIQAMSLQLILGGAGLLSLGHAAYFAVGAYSAGAFSVFAAPALGLSSPFIILLLALIVGGIAAGLAGLLVAIPTLRLQGDYLAMATLGFGEIVSTVFKNLEVVGGTRGFKDIPKYTSPLGIWVAVFAVALFLKRFYKTGLGYSILATRDDEIAARSIGISTQVAKVSAFVIGSALAGIAGGFYAHALQFVSPDAADFSRSVEIVLAVVIGGMFSMQGSILGAFILVAVPEVLRFAPGAIAEKRMLFFALFVIVLMIVNPRGLSALFARLRKGTGSALAPTPGSK